MSRTYVDAIKTMIGTEARQHATESRVTAEFINDTFVRIEPKIRLMEDAIWEIPPVDVQTLQSFFETAKREYLSIHPIKIDPSSSLTKEGFKTWLTAERDKSTAWNYTDRYLDYLRDLGRSENVVTETQRSSRDILGKLGDPKLPSEFFVKGLVVGEVQSGKTANFNAVINRSIDCGYKLIIVLSGIMEDLRGQTQNRIEDEVVGYGAISDFNQSGIKGVGTKRRFGMQGVQSIQQIESITSCDTDFSGALLKSASALDAPKILICKKNVSILRNLINWLAEMLNSVDDQHAVPLLILDDEADNASLNNEGAKGREYASKINGHIRAILALFQRKSYLGYTASPFANVLQDRNDPAENPWPVKSSGGERQLAQVDNLFPDDFIVLLDSPTNYVGAKQIFETISDRPKLPVATAVSDHSVEFPTRLLRIDGSPVENFPTREEWDERVGQYGSYLGFQNHSEYRRNTRASKREDAFPQALPRSLKDAILAFILGIAVREGRKQSQSSSSLYNPHNTMLVHISRFTTWQNKTAKLITEFMADLKARVENEKPADDGSVYLEFEDAWNRHFADIVTNIREYLPEGYEDGFMVPTVFKSIRRFIPAATDEIDVLSINSSTGHKLEYPKKVPRKIIAIGGNRLSRGFTVEGLTINYFVRSTNYSDTLLQMGRWFGYRPGYLDCCRIFTTRESIEKFNSTTRCIEELESQFKKMRDQDKSPRNFLLKVRKDPGVLKITRPSILKNTKTVKWSYQDQLEMTTKFDVTKEKIEDVWSAFKSETAPLFANDDGADEQFFKTELNGSKFLEFLKTENNFDTTTLETMIRFIELCQEQGKLTDWTVAVKRTGNSVHNLSSVESNLPGVTGLLARKGPTMANQDHRDLFLTDKVFRASGRSANIVSSPRDLSITLEKHEIAEAEKHFRDGKKRQLIKQGVPEPQASEEAQRNPKTIPERVYRERIPEFRGVLIIYLFDSRHAFNHVKNKPSEEPDKDFEKLVKDGRYDLSIPLVGYAIGFPPIADDPGGIYAHGDFDLDADEAGEEDLQADDSSVPEDGFEG